MGRHRPDSEADQVFEEGAFSFGLVLFYRVRQTGNFFFGPCYTGAALRKTGGDAISEPLLWIYLVNSTLLVNHEIDAVYWKEWDLFNVRGGITGFILLHIPLVFIILFGLVMVLRDGFWGPVMSLVMGAVGVFTFSIHAHYLKKGRKEFRTPLSLSILGAILVVSAVQIGFACLALA